MDYETPQLVIQIILAFIPAMIIGMILISALLS